MRKLVVVLGIVVAVFCVIALSVWIGARHFLPGLGPMTRGMAQADKLFPKPHVLLEYERIGDEYAAGRIETELLNVDRIALEPICLGSASAWSNDPDIYYITFVAGRLMPACAVIRRIGYDTLEYARKLGKEGKGDEALRAELAALAIARQLIHVEPHDSSPLLSGLGLWKSSWREIGKQLDAKGDKGRARRAYSCTHQAMVYLEERVKPVNEADGREVDAFERELKKLPKSKQEAYTHRHNLESVRGYARDGDQLVKQWDAEVDTVAAKQLERELRLLAER